jgi:hypothetical protein
MIITAVYSSIASSRGLYLFSLKLLIVISIIKKQLLSVRRTQVLIILGWYLIDFKTQGIFVLAVVIDIIITRRGIGGIDYNK